MILFDELNLAEKSKDKPLKVLHSKLDGINTINVGICLIGTSNYNLDQVKAIN